MQGEAASSCMSSATLLNLLCAKAAALAGDQAGQRLVQKLLEAAAGENWAKRTPCCPAAV
jgi:hypothetical protein